MIVFELTGDWQTGIAVMASVSLSTALASKLVDRSFFLTQLERRGIHLAAGPQAYLLAMLRAGAVMRPASDPAAPRRGPAATWSNRGSASRPAPRWRRRCRSSTAPRWTSCR